MKRVRSPSSSPNSRKRVRDSSSPSSVKDRAVASVRDRDVASVRDRDVALIREEDRVGKYWWVRERLILSICDAYGAGTDVAWHIFRWVFSSILRERSFRLGQECRCILMRHGWKRKIAHFQNEFPPEDDLYWEQGLCKSWMGDQLIRWCMYKGGKPDGVAKRWHPNGHLFMTEQWKDGEKNGKEVYWRSTGIKRLSARHVNGALHGNEKLYNYDGTMTSMTTYVRGRKETQWVYDPQGNPVHFLQFIRRRFPYTTSRYTLKRYSKGGVAESIESYESGQKDGKQVELYDDGQTKAVEHFKYGIQNGLQERYYRSERLKLQYHCKHGERHGPFKAYYPSGRMKQRGGFRRGKPDGEFTTYYDQEQSHIWEFVKWKNGKQDGVSRTFYSDGSEHTRCDWVDGVQKIETLRTCGDESLYKPPPH